MTLMGRAKYVVLLDTNFLMLPSHEKVNIFASVEECLQLRPRFAALKSTVEELRRIASEGGPKERRAALLGLELVERCGVELVDDSAIPGDSADDKIVEYAREALMRGDKLIVATNDRELRRRLRELGVSVILYRERDHRVWLDGEV